MLVTCETLASTQEIKWKYRLGRCYSNQRKGEQAGLNQKHSAKCGSSFLDILGTVVAQAMIDTYSGICTSGSHF